MNANDHYQTALRLLRAACTERDPVGQAVAHMLGALVLLRALDGPRDLDEWTAWRHSTAPDAANTQDNR